MRHPRPAISGRGTRTLPPPIQIVYLYTIHMSTYSTPIHYIHANYKGYVEEMKYKHMHNIRQTVGMIFVQSLPFRIKGGWWDGPGQVVLLKTLGRHCAAPTMRVIARDVNITWHRPYVQMQETSTSQGIVDYPQSLIQCNNFPASAADRR